jgi:tRNA dimethylallyltransferase
MSSYPIFCIMGPTASGKTQLAIELIERFPFEIISVDSAMVYRDMNIGTAKPSEEVLQRAPHRLIDIRDPLDAYSAAEFREDALREIDAIQANNKIPLLVGGTMLYFRTLQQGLSDLPSADPFIRAQLNQIGEEQGWSFLHERLLKIDPVAGQRIHPNDSQRIQRALEVYEMTGKSLTDWQKENKEMPTHHTIYNIAVAPSDRAVLHNRIELRFQAMLTEGFIEEVERLFARGDLHLELPSMRAVGYRQVWEYLLGNLGYADMQEKGIIATRQLAKRQLTWLRGMPDLLWFNSETPQYIDQVMRIMAELFKKEGI